MADSTKTNQQIPRRTALGGLSLILGGTFGTALGIPVASILADSRSSNKQSPLRTGESVLGPVDRFSAKPRKVVIMEVRRDGWLIQRSVAGVVWVIKTPLSPSGFLVFSATCPHLGCSINATNEGFRCSCHESRFQPNGQRVISGKPNPSPRDMDTLEHRVHNGVLLCKYQRFEVNAEAKISLDG